jgi:glycopeptide antibiotics resistance protein
MTVVSTRRGRRGLLCLAVGLVLVAVLPWRGFTAHSHWDEVRWVPFSSRLVVRDVVANLMLFLPFGAGVAMNVTQSPVGRAGGWGLALSLFGEFSQVFSHGRFPSATDVVCNVAGAVFGAKLLEWLRGAGPT